MIRTEPTRPFPTKAKRGVLQITLLIGPDGDKLYGVDTAHGRLWKPSKDELFKALRFIFDCRKIEVVDTWLSRGQS